MLGWQDAMVLMTLGFFLFGAQRLPETMKALGTSAAEFKKGLEGKDEPKPPADDDKAAR